METNQVTTQEEQGSKVRGGEEENNEDEERVTSSSDCKKSGGSDPVRAFQEDMDMEGLSGRMINLQGCTKMLFPGCVEMDEIVEFCSTTAGRRA